MMAAAFGVHFGCTSSCIAVCKDDKTDVIANDAGDRVTPAVVAFSDVEQLVGLAAWQQMGRNPANTICNVKRLLGRPFGHSDVESAVKSSTVKIINNSDKPVYSVTYKEKLTTFKPVEVAAMVYKKMMETAESHSGASSSHDAVLSVPLAFDKEQCTAIRDAATKAGFNVLRIITEPSAAVLAYGIGQKDPTETCCYMQLWTIIRAAEISALLFTLLIGGANLSKNNVMVLRVGGQSTEISVVAVTGGMYRILSSVEMHDVGGNLIDDILVDHFAAEFARQSRLNCRSNVRAVGKLRVAVDTCKRVLSTMNVAQCSIDSLHEGIDFNGNLSRSRFEALCSSFVQSCIQPIDSCLTKGNLKREDIHKVILCGGCCRIPLLQQQVQEYFSTAEFLQGIAPDEVLAVGCAVQAAMLVGRDSTEVEQFSRECELDCLAVEVLVRLNTVEKAVSVIPPFTPIPVRRQTTLTLSAGEASAVIDVLQRIPDSNETEPLAQLSLADLAEGSSINVVIHFRHDGILHVTCSEPTSGRSQDVLIETAC